MAARKSCTHLTWAEAKGKVGGSTSSKSKAISKKVPHHQILAQKIISKQEGEQGPTISRAKLRRSQREDEKAASIKAAAREAEKEERRNRKVKPHELAQDRMLEIVKNLQATSSVVIFEEEESNNSKESIMEIKECKEMQLDEVMALEAIYADTNDFLVSDSSRLEDLREIREILFADDDDQNSIESFIQHPPISFYIQFRIDDYREDTETSLVAYIILSVSLPPRYPMGATPRFELSDIMIVDKTDLCSPDKTLETLAFLDQEKLLDDLRKQAEMVLPDPCVYEAATWLTENVFDAALQMRTHGSLA